MDGRDASQRHASFARNGGAWSSLARLIAGMHRTSNDRQINADEALLLCRCSIEMVHTSYVLLVLIGPLLARKSPYLLLWAMFVFGESPGRCGIESPV